MATKPKPRNPVRKAAPVSPLEAATVLSLDGRLGGTTPDTDMAQLATQMRSLQWATAGPGKVARDALQRGAPGLWRAAVEMTDSELAEVLGLTLAVTS